MDILKSLYSRGIRDPVTIMNAYLERGQLRITFGQNHRRKVGPYRSIKMGRVYYDGPHELSCLKWIDTLDEIIAFLPQPMIIVLDAAGHEHFPDFLILFRGGYLEVWETKDVSMYDEKFQAIEKISRHELSFYGVGYEVYTNQPVYSKGHHVNCLPTGHYKMNIDLMFRYRTHYLDGKESLLTNWPEDLTLSFGDLQAGVLGKPILLNDLFALISRKQLRIDLETEVNGQTLVSCTAKR